MLRPDDGSVLGCDDGIVEGLDEGTTLGCSLGPEDDNGLGRYEGMVLAWASFEYN